VYGSVPFVTGVKGNAAFFDNSQFPPNTLYDGVGTYFTVPNAAGSGALTLLFWVKHMSGQRSGGFTNPSGAAHFQNGIGMQLDFFNNDNDLFCAYGAMPNTWTVEACFQSMPHGVWVHLAVTVSNSHLVTIYKNGVATASVQGGTGMQAAQLLVIGRSANDAGGSASAYFDELYLFSGVLTQSQIVAVMNT
jgi:hypothetical protein